MINLLPDEYKNELRAARTNLVLIRYTGIILVATVFIMSVVYVSYSVLQQTMSTAEARIETNATKAAVFSSTKKQVDILSAQLSNTKVLLDQATNYSTLLTTIGAAMPQGTVLDSLKITSETLQNQTPIKLTAYAKSESNAASIQQQLQASGLFSQVTIESTNATGGITDYPVKVSLSVTFKGRSS